MSDDLVERVVALYRDKWGVNDHGLAQRAIALALEEAANVADFMGKQDEGTDGHGVAYEVAAAIRKLIPKENT